MEDTWAAVVYRIDDCEFNITEKDEIHEKLRADEEFLKNYVAESQADLVTNAVAEGDGENEDFLKNNVTEPQTYLVPNANAVGDGEGDCSENTKTFKWNNEATKYLIKTYMARLNKFRDPKILNKTLWSEISQEMNHAGYNVDEGILFRKMRSMRTTYERNNEEQSKSSKTRRHVAWEHYDAFEKIYSGDLIINCGPDMSEINGDAVNALQNQSNQHSQNEDEEASEKTASETEAFKWETKSTDYFIKIYLRKLKKFRDPKIMKRTVWSEVANEMIQAGYKVDEDMLDRKMRNMRKTYKTIKENSDKKKTREVGNRAKWPYFDTFENIFSSEGNENFDGADASGQLSAEEAETPHVTKNKPTAWKETFKWETKATKYFIKIYKERLDKFRDPKVMKKTLWSELAHLMKQFGCVVDEDMLDRKMRNMKKTYKTIKNNTSKTSRRHIKWEYFDVFEEMFSNTITLNSDPLMLKKETSCDDDEDDEPVIQQQPQRSTEDSCPHAADKKPQFSAPHTTEDEDEEDTPLHKINGKKAKRRKRTLYYMRKKLLKIEERKAAASEDLNRIFRENNRLVQERNELLRRFLESNIANTQL